MKKLQPNEIIEYANLAYKILNQGGTDYKKNKNVITNLFNSEIANTYEDKIKTRLCVIDSFYSTNIRNRRYFGIDDISSIFVKHKTSNLIEKFNKCLINFDSELFPINIGINKKGKNAGHSHSIISKYGYFLTNYQFPIFDSIVRENLPFIINLIEHQNIDTKIINNIEILFNQIGLLKRITSLDYEKIDNLIWLFGKVKKGNISMLFVNKNTYINYCIELGIDKVDTIEDITNKLKNNYKNLTTINTDTKKFLNFVFETNNN